MLTASGICKRYGRKEALRGVSLEVRGGELYGLAGPNGAGKSTLLGVLSGLLRATGGELRWDGRPVSADRVEWKRIVGVVPERLGLLEFLSLEEQLELVGELYGLEAAERARRARELLEYLDLWDERSCLAREASAGMRKKLALALALLHEPRLLLLDEGLAETDPASRVRAIALLRALRDRGAAILLVTHDLELLEREADRVGILVHGRLEREVEPGQARTRGRTLEQEYLLTVPEAQRLLPDYLCRD